MALRPSARLRSMISRYGSLRLSRGLRVGTGGHGGGPLPASSPLTESVCTSLAGFAPLTHGRLSPSIEALDRIAAVMNERSRGVRLRRVDDGLEISGKKPDAAELTITIPASGWKDDEVIGVNLRYLHDAVRFAPS